MGDIEKLTTLISQNGILKKRFTLVKLYVISKIFNSNTIFQSKIEVNIFRNRLIFYRHRGEDPLTDFL